MIVSSISCFRFVRHVSFLFFISLFFFQFSSFLRYNIHLGCLLLSGTVCIPPLLTSRLEHAHSTQRRTRPKRLLPPFSSTFLHFSPSPLTSHDSPPPAPNTTCARYPDPRATGAVCRHLRRMRRPSSRPRSAKPALGRFCCTFS